MTWRLRKGAHFPSPLSPKRQHFGDPPWFAGRDSSLQDAATLDRPFVRTVFGGTAEGLVLGKVWNVGLCLIPRLSRLSAQYELPSET